MTTDPIDVERDARHAYLPRNAVSRAVTQRRRLPRLIAFALALAACACGSGSEPSQGAAPLTAPDAPVTPLPSPAPSPANRVVIRSTGMIPAEIAVAVGSRVTFVNEDTSPHDVAGGADIAHPDCREIDAAGFLVPGQSRQTDPLPVARTCDYHDHSNHSATFTGRIVIR